MSAPAASDESGAVIGSTKRCNLGRDPGGRAKHFRIRLKMVKSSTQETKSYAQMVLEMFMTAPQVTVRGARVPSDMSRCNSSRQHKRANWANAHQFPLASK
ncbi:hypothetical protein ACHHYP_05491 [Achlya hypogyna]|uniref:Uncharacterized protein n=1 Tax=Achlya hypogyna TaxID=1202772 RepID=A0A1V9YXU4_ACHHY|nr:hypothetical protein ACHHYP_05491 [Achlya hypogyna]